MFKIKIHIPFISFIPVNFVLNNLGGKPREKVAAR